MEPGFDPLGLGDQRSDVSCRLGLGYGASHKHGFHNGIDYWCRRICFRPPDVVAYDGIHIGSPPECNAVPVPKEAADNAMDAATCIGCGACVAACPNASASLFVSAKISQMSWLPQGEPERARRALQMVTQMDDEGFGDCSNHGECEAVCPKEISIQNIARMRREFVKAAFKG